MTADRIADGRMNVFVGHSVSSAMWSPLGTALLAFIQGPITGWERAAIWFVLINITQLAVLSAAYAHRGARTRGSDGKIEAQLLVTATFLVGVAWGSSVFFFWSPGQYVFYLTNLTMLVGVTGVCIVIMSPIRIALTSFVSATMLLPVVHLLTIDGYHWKEQTAIGLITMMIFSLKYGRMAEKQLTSALEEVMRNELLAGELVRHATALETAKAELSEAFAVAHIGSWLYDFHTDSVRLSAQTRHFYDASESIQRGRAFLLNITVAEDRRGLLATWNQALVSGEFDHEHRITTVDGIRWVRQKSRIEFDIAGIPLRSIGITQDITARKSADEEIRSLAFFDPLTMLPNRRLMLTRLREALFRSEKRESAGALLVIDLDEFKMLNDTLGHDVGDRFLVEVASRLRSCVRDGDTVARQGGDEFVVVLEGLNSSAGAVDKAQLIALAINVAISRPYQLELYVEGVHNVQHYHCTSSIGIATFQGERVSGDELMKRADTAMYRAKKAGRNTFRFFDTAMQEEVTKQANLNRDLHEAIRLEQFILYYQPQMDHKGQIVGAEALIRWCHPECGLIGPGEFIPEAECSGLILSIGLWVIETAFAQLAIWQKNSVTAHLTLAVNVSTRQFHQPQFVQQTKDLISRTGVNPRGVKFELTESILLDDVEGTITKMEALRILGASFSLDDFGTGYSSLAYLRRLPIDQLKIDRAFVRDILEETGDVAIAATIITLAKTLGLAVIAEGVETESQRDFLIRQGCHFFQGFLFSQPLKLDDFERFARSSA